MSAKTFRAATISATPKIVQLTEPAPGAFSGKGALRLNGQTYVLPEAGETEADILAEAKRIHRDDPKLSRKGLPASTSSAKSSPMSSLSDDFDAALRVERKSIDPHLDALFEQYRREDDAEDRLEQQLDVFKRLSHLSRHIRVIACENREAAMELNRMLSAGWQTIDVERAEQLETAARMTLQMSGCAW